MILTPTTRTLKIPFPTAHLADTALQVLRVDEELSPLVQRSFELATASAPSHPSTGTSTSTFTPSPTPTDLSQALHAQSLDDDTTTPETQIVLLVHYKASTNRMLRVAINGFFESIGVVLSAMRELDVDVVGEEWIGEALVEGKETEGQGAVRELRRVQGLQERGTL